MVSRSFLRNILNINKSFQSKCLQKLCETEKTAQINCPILKGGSKQNKPKEDKIHVEYLSSERNFSIKEN